MQEFKGYGWSKITIDENNVFIKQLFLKENCTLDDIRSVRFIEPIGLINGCLQIRTQKQNYSIFFLASKRSKFLDLYNILQNRSSNVNIKNDFKSTKVIDTHVKIDTVMQNIVNEKVEPVNIYKNWSGKQLFSFPDSYIVTDIETSGLIAGKNSIIEIAALKIKNGIIINKYSSFIHRDKPLSKEIINMTGITSEMLRAETKDLSTVITEYKNFIEGLPLVGHNIITFDIRFINFAFLEIFHTPITNDCIDTLSLSRQYVDNTDNHKLQTLAKHFDISVTTAHRAIDDCLTTYGLSQKIHEIILEKKNTTLNSLNEVDNMIIQATSTVFNGSDAPYFRYEKKGSYLIAKCFYPIFRVKTKGKTGIYIVIKNQNILSENDELQLKTAPATSTDGGGIRYFIQDIESDFLKLKPILLRLHDEIYENIIKHQDNYYKRFKSDLKDYLNDITLINLK